MNGWPKWSDEAGIKSMDDNHLKNTVNYIKRKMPELSEEDEHFTADYWSVTGVLFVPGKPWFKERLKEINKEIERRNI